MKGSCAILTLIYLCIPLMQVPAMPVPSIAAPAFQEEQGFASYYAGKFQGRHTANGEVFDTNKLTAAHPTLPFNTIVKVTNEANGKSVRVRINDRGPFVKGRIIDLSRAAAAQIGMLAEGVAYVSLVVVELGDGKPYHILASTPGDVLSVIIQVGAFRNLENAHRVIDSLRQQGFDPQSVELADGITRVVLKDVPKDSVAEMRKKLANAGFPDILVRLPQ